MDSTNILKKEAKVSIIMNCYNGDHFLREAIKSILSQGHTNWEIIFWDNQSTDESARIFHSYNDPRFKYYRSENHTNLSSARKNALLRCTGEYVAFLDVDDEWHSDKLAIQLQELQASDADVIYSNYNVKNENNKEQYIRYKKNELPEGNITRHLLKRNFVNLLTLLAKRKSISSLKNIFPSDLAFACDYDFVIRLSHQLKFKCIDESLGLYRIHSRNDSTPKWTHIKELQSMYKELQKVQILQKRSDIILFKLLIERTRIKYFKYLILK